MAVVQNQPVRSLSGRSESAPGECDADCRLRISDLDPGGAHDKDATVDRSVGSRATHRNTAARTCCKVRCECGRLSSHVPL